MIDQIMISKRNQVSFPPHVSEFVEWGNTSCSLLHHRNIFLGFHQGAVSCEPLWVAHKCENKFQIYFALLLCTYHNILDLLELIINIKEGGLEKLGHQQWQVILCRGRGKRSELRCVLPWKNTIFPRHWTLSSMCLKVLSTCQFRVGLWPRFDVGHG